MHAYRPLNKCFSFHFRHAHSSQLRILTKSGCWNSQFHTWACTKSKVTTWLAISWPDQKKYRSPGVVNNCFNKPSLIFNFVTECQMKFVPGDLLDKSLKTFSIFISSVILAQKRGFNFEVMEASFVGSMTYKGTFLLQELFRMTFAELRPWFPQCGCEHLY